MTTPAPSASKSNPILMKRYLLMLKNAEPEGYEGFLKEFETYTNEALYGLSAAPQDQILSQQGRAQQCLAMLRMFRECHLVPKTVQPTP